MTITALNKYLKYQQNGFYLKLIKMTLFKSTELLKNPLFIDDLFIFKKNTIKIEFN